MVDIRLLTMREAAAVAAVTAHYAEHAHPPSCKEIAHRLGVRTSQADRLIKAAASLGSLIVVRRKGIRTQVRLARPPVAVPELNATFEKVPSSGNDRETNSNRLAA